MTGPVVPGTRLPERQVAPIGKDGIAAYLAVSGDDNPLHSDPDLARRAGLDGIPVPGLMVLAILGDLVEAWPVTEAVLRLSVRFVSPTYAESALIFGGRVVAVNAAAGTATLRLTATQIGRLTSMGEAEIRLRR